MKKLFALFLVLVLAFSLVACGETPAEEPQDGGEEPAETGKRKIAVFNYNSMMPSANPIIEGMVDVIEEHGDEYLYVAADGTEENQLQVFDELVARDDIDAIIWPNNKDTLLLDSCKRAKEKGIVLTTMDLALADDENTRVVNSQTIVDNYQGAYNVADAVLDELEARGVEPKIITADYYGTAAMALRGDGYGDALKDHGVEALYRIDIAAAGDLGNMVEDLLIKYPECNGIFVCYDAGCVKALASCKAQGRDDILLCSFDGGTDVQDYIKNGEIFAAAYQPLYEMGRNCADVVYKELNGEPHEYWYTYDCVTMTKDNVQEIIDLFNSFSYSWMK